MRKVKGLLAVCFVSVICMLVFGILHCSRGELNAGQENQVPTSTETSEYQKLWKQVKDFQSQGLPKSVMGAVEKIYQKAKTSGHAAQLIKALIHKLRYYRQVEEGTIVKLHQTLLKELKESSFPVKPVLHSMLAEQYWNYYRQNRYRILRRTATTEAKPDDIRTWDMKTLVQEVVNHYKASLSEPEKSQRVRIELYDPILLQNTSGRIYRPSLYDFLAHRAVDFFMHSESGLTQPVYRFTLNDAAYFSPARQFAEMKITTRDPMSFKYYALVTLQSLVRFHLDDPRPDALVDADLKRLDFLYKDAVISNKEQVYEKTLRELIKQYGDSPVTTDVTYELARLYYRLGDKYKPVPVPSKTAEEPYRWHKKKARGLCAEAVKKHPRSTGARNCQHLINQIDARRLDITVEKGNLPDTALLARAGYKNLDKIYIRVFKTSPQEIRQKQRRPKEQVLRYFLQKEPVLEQDLPLENSGDYQAHAAEFSIKPLGTGEYILVAAETPDFNFRRHAAAYTFFSVSRISYITRRQSPKGLEFYLLDRHTGRPLPGAEAQTWYQRWDNSAQQYKYNKGPRFQADKNGYIRVPHRPGKNQYFHVQFIHGDDQLFPSRNFNTRQFRDRHKRRTSTFFFTDRSIYRPGQTVYFKGIMVETDSAAAEKTRILPNRSTKVLLKDTSYQKVAELNLQTNEFGTFNGSFQLPTGRMNGNWHISGGNGNGHFSVEEYKRPKFFVDFPPMEKSYRLNDSVTIEGKATAYAGYNIDNAQVKIRVVRRVFFPYRWLYWWYPPVTSEMEILNETTQTDAAGAFEVTFKAEPDLGISKSRKPAFWFTLYADITDINGETRSGEKAVAIGYTALKLGLDLPGKIDKNLAQKQQEFNISTTTLSGDFIPAQGTVSIQKLKAPKRVFRKKLWSMPDTVTMKKDQYLKQFPHDSYKGEHDYRRWEKEKEVYSKPFDTAKDKKLRLSGLSRWNTGKYRLEISSRDRFGNDVKDVRYFTLYDSKSKKLPLPLLTWSLPVTSTVEPGQKAVLLIGSSARNVTVIYEVEHRGQLVSKHVLTLNNQQKRIEIPIAEKHRGNLGLRFTFVKYNRMFNHTHTINVPWSNKLLDISFETFRNKLQPGQKEEWRLRVRPKKGKAGPGFMAEMVAALYDASLDAFRPHGWSFGLFSHYYPRFYWNSNQHFGTANSVAVGPRQTPSSFTGKNYDRFNWFGFYLENRILYKSKRLGAVQSAIPPPAPRTEAALADTGVEPMEMAKRPGKKMNGDKEEAEADDDAPTSGEAEPGGSEAGGGGKEDLSQVKARTNLQETAFFYPQLRSGKDGEIVIAFTIPEALTKWKMLGFAHTKDLSYGITTNELVTQKDLMVVPNIPRFFREDDSMRLTTKITNISDKKLNGKARLMFFDALTLQPVDAKFQIKNPEQSFTVEKGQSTPVHWDIQIPDDLDTVTYRIVAKAGKFSDGEEQPIPILKNRMLVTESLPLPVRSNQTKNFVFKKLVESQKSTTLKHHKLTLEFTANPVWYAVQALPYLMEFPHECMEQVFSRYYANSIAHHVVNANPAIKRVFKVWEKTKDSGALLSNLEKNQELKSLLLEETPWVLNAQNESQRKKRVALLFDLNRMASELNRALKKLKEGQKPSGAWPWFNGMRDSRYITQHIVTGFAHLDRLKVVEVRKNKDIWPALKKALPYLDRKIKEDYQWLLDHKKNLDKMWVSNLQVHYLYVRGYFADIPMDDNVNKAFKYYKKQAAQYWLKFNRYSQGMIALALHRFGDKKIPTAIIKSLKEHALHSEEMGMYWKDSYGFYWYQAPIETQAMMIEVFSEIANDQVAVDDMRTWLLKQKQTQDWATTKATTEACYALLLRGTQWLSETKLPDITLGKTKKIKVDPAQMDNVKVEAGTGYFKTSWNNTEITPDMGHVTVKNNNNVVAWGSLYWQYFETLENITPAKTPLQLTKKLYVQRPSDTGPVLHPLDKSDLKVGDRVKVRITLRVDRLMEYVHMKDMRAAGFEPENVISRCKWQDGLGYYESTKDAAVHFFMDQLPKGTYVFEYPLRVSHTGDFSNGITTIQCMYAPEFTSHSKGIRVKIQ